jgi:hypothetical protein
MVTNHEIFLELLEGAVQDHLEVEAKQLQVSMGHVYLQNQYKYIPGMLMNLDANSGLQNHFSKFFRKISVKMPALVFTAFRPKNFHY